MAEEAGKNDGWGIFDRLKNLPHVISVKGDLKRTPVRTSYQAEFSDDDSDVQEIPAPHEQQEQQDPLTNYESGEGGEEFENTKIDGALSNRDLLNQLHAIAVGVRDFEVLGAKPKLTQVVGEVKVKRVRSKKSTSDNSSKSKTKESSEKKLSTPRKATSKIKAGIIVKEAKAREILPFSDSYLQKAFLLSNVSQSSEKSNNDTSAKKPLKAKTLTTKQPTSRFRGDIIKPATSEAQQIELGVGSEENLAAKKKARQKDLRLGTEEKLATKKARQRELGVGSEEKLGTKKKAKVSAKSTVNQRMRALLMKKRVLSEAAVAELAAAKEQQAAAGTEMTKLLDEIRSMTKDSCDDLPSDVTERWITARAKQLCTSFDFHCAVIRNALCPIPPKVDP